MVITPGLKSKTLIGSLHVCSSCELLPVKSVGKLSPQNKENWTQRLFPLSTVAGPTFPVSFVFSSSSQGKGVWEEDAVVENWDSYCLCKQISFPFSLATSVVLPVSGSPLSAYEQPPRHPPFQKTNKLNRQMLVFAYLLVGVIWNGVIQPLSAASLLPLLCHHCSKCKCGLKDGMSRWELSTGYCWSVTPSVQQISCQMVSCCCHRSLQSRFPALLAIYFCAPAMMPVVLATCRLALP